MSWSFSNKKRPFFYFITPNPSLALAEARGRSGTVLSCGDRGGSIPTARPRQGTTWADGCIFPNHLFALCLFLVPHLWGDVAYQKAEKDFFTAALSKHPAPASCQAPEDHPDPSLPIDPEVNGAPHALIAALILFSGQKHPGHPQQPCLPVLGGSSQLVPLSPVLGQEEPRDVRRC